jgi:hypothetical protein
MKFIQIRIANAQMVPRIILGPVKISDTHYFQFPVHYMPVELFKAVEQGDLPEVAISREHARALSGLVAWFKLVIEKRAEPNAPLTLEYCEELLEVLKIEREEFIS